MSDSDADSFSMQVQDIPAHPSGGGDDCDAASAVSIATSEIGRAPYRPGSSSGDRSDEEGLMQDMAARKRLTDTESLSPAAVRTLSWMHSMLGPRVPGPDFMGAQATGDVAVFTGKFDNAAVPKLQMEGAAMSFGYVDGEGGPSLEVRYADVASFASGVVRGKRRQAHMTARQELANRESDRLELNERPGIGLPSCFCPLVVDLTPLETQPRFVRLVMGAVQNTTELEFPNTRMPIPVLTGPLFEHLDARYDDAAASFQRVGLTKPLMGPLTRSAALRTLTLVDCMVLEDVEIADMPHLHTLALAPLAVPCESAGRISVHCEKLPSLKRLRVNTGRGILTKEYGMTATMVDDPRAEGQRWRLPTPRWRPMRLAVVRVTGTETCALRELELVINGEDFDDLVRKPCEENVEEAMAAAFHPLLRFRSVKRLRVLAQLRELSGMLYRRRSGDCNLSPYNPFPLQQAMVARGHPAYANVTLDQIETVRYTETSVLTDKAARQFHAAVQQMRVRVLSLNAQAAIALRWARYDGVFVREINPSTGATEGVHAPDAPLPPPALNVPAVIIEMNPLLRTDMIAARKGERVYVQKITEADRLVWAEDGIAGADRVEATCPKGGKTVELLPQDFPPPMVREADAVYPWVVADFVPWYHISVAANARVTMLPGCADHPGQGWLASKANTQVTERAQMAKDMERLGRLSAPAMLRRTTGGLDLCKYQVRGLRALVGK
ncbi:MAG TPA: hypothetical protein VKD22_15670 [Ramlibacter sp.]|jgi:hypothetical protein|nr:hypothetical protein [Ramlibacter sp.]